MPDTLVVENDGPLLVGSNYWGLPMARAGKILVSTNAGAFRLMVPRSLEYAIAEMNTARECVVSRGPWPNFPLEDGFEILFDDCSANPFALHLSPGSFDRLPTDEDIGIPWTLAVYTAPRRSGRPHRAFQRPCWYRRVPRIPWLKPR
jgi:hypothetical protein